MKRLPLGDSKGITLVELVVVAGVVSVVLTALCEVYLAAAKGWEHQQAESLALSSASQACSRICQYAEQSVDVLVQDRPDGSQSLALCLPADTVNGIYVPVMEEGLPRYRHGQWIVFYLSDTTGSYSSTGDILWAATLDDYALFPAGLVPDQSWSLYYNTHVGRISNLRSLRFALSESGELRSVTVQVGASCGKGNSTHSLEIRRTQCLRNSLNTI